MTNQITSTEEITEFYDLDQDEAPESDLAATEQPAPGAKIEFFVQMRSWTQRDMEDLVIEAAATRLLAGMGESRLKRKIEDAALANITSKLDGILEAITAEIIDKPLTPEPFGKQPVTMREFIGLYGREYLDQRVDRDGKPTSNRAFGSTQNSTRMQRIVQQHMDQRFKKEIEASTQQIVRDCQNAIKASHQEILNAEKERVKAALERALTAK